MDDISCRVVCFSLLAVEQTAYVDDSSFISGITERVGLAVFLGWGEPSFKQETKTKSLL